MDLTSALILAVVALGAFVLAFGMFYIKLYETRQHLDMIESLTNEVLEAHIQNAEHNQTILGLHQELRNAHSTIEMVLDEREKPCSQEHSSSSSDSPSEDSLEYSLDSFSGKPLSESHSTSDLDHSTHIDQEKLDQAFKRLGELRTPTLDKEPHVQEDDPVQGLQREGSEPADPPQSE